MAILGIMFTGASQCPFLLSSVLFSAPVLSFYFSTSLDMIFHEIYQLSVTMTGFRFSFASFELFSYLLNSFAGRYIREVYSVRKRVPLNITYNRIELSIFIVYTLYSFFTAILHVISIREELNHKYSEQPKLELTKPKGFALFYEVLEVIIHLYIVVEKLTHFMHANHRYELSQSRKTPAKDAVSRAQRFPVFGDTQASAKRQE